MIIADASAILAGIRQETGFERVEEHLGHLLISAVNYCEVLQSLIKDGQSPDRARRTAAPFIDDVVDVGLSQAERAAALIVQTRPFGLGIADRLCLALAIERGRPALTADRAWAELQIDGLDVDLIR